MCTQCNDTGSLSKNVDGYLDCPHCPAAEERTQLNTWIRERRSDGDLGGLFSNDAWLIYQLGKAAAAGATN